MLDCILNRKNCEQKLPLWMNLLSANIEVADARYFSRLMLINALLYLAVIVQAAMTLFYSVVEFDSGLALANSAGLVVFTLMVMYVRKKQRFVFIGHTIAVLSIAIYGTLLWSDTFYYELLMLGILVPFILVLLNGTRLGLGYLMVFFVTVSPAAYQGIGVWQDGLWSYANFMQFMVSLLLASIISLILEFSRCISARRDRMRFKEQQGNLEKFERLSKTDAVTGLYNRHYFHQVMAEQLPFYENSELSVSFFLVDIDDFKLYNDSYGHQVGDQVLHKVAQAILHYIKRENDLVFRLGGEEFGGLVAGREPEKTERWLAGLVKVIEELKIPSASGCDYPYLSVSVGLSSAKISSQQDFDQLYKHADDGMYLAKQHGRGRVARYSGQDCIEFMP